MGQFKKKSTGPHSVTRNCTSMSMKSTTFYIFSPCVQDANRMKPCGTGAENDSFNLPYFVLKFIENNEKSGFSEKKNATQSKI